MDGSSKTVGDASMTSTKKVYIEVALEAYEKLEAELEHATKEFERNNAFTHKRLTELQAENQQQHELILKLHDKILSYEEQIADANKILSNFSFCCKDCTLDDVNHLRGVLQSTAEEKTP